MSQDGKGQWRKRSNQQDGASRSGPSKKRKYFAAANTAGLPLGSRGFLISCIGGKEQQAAFEAGRLLQEYFDAALPKTEDQKPEAGAGADLGALIAEEVQALKQDDSRLFKYVKTNVNGLLYLDMRRDVEGPGPTELVLALAQAVEGSRQCKSRLCVRFSPVEHVVQGSVSAMTALAKGILQAAFPPETDAAPGTKFAVQYEHRASVKLDRKQVIDAFVEQIPCPPYKVDLERPDKTILIQVVRNSATVAVVPQYWQLRKFNIRELCMSDEERAAQEAENAAARAQQAAKTAAKAAATSAAAEAQRRDAADAVPSATEPPAAGLEKAAADNAAPAADVEQAAADDAARKTAVADGAEAPAEAAAADTAGDVPDAEAQAHDASVAQQDNVS